MTWAATFALAMANLRRRLVRAGLTVLGVALGSGLLVALVTISATADTNVISRLSHGGPVTAISVAAALPKPDQLDSDSLQAGDIHLLNDDAVAAIRRAPYVTSVVPVMTSEAVAVPPSGDPYFGLMIGTDLTQIDNLPITVLAGRVPRPGSLTEVAVGTSYLDHLNLQPSQAPSVVGTQLELGSPKREPGVRSVLRARWIRLTIVGVVAQQVANGDFLVPIQQTMLSRQWALGGQPDPDFPLLASPYTGLIVVSSTLDEVHTVRAEITALGYATSAPEHLIATVQRYLHVVDIVLGSIGTVALVIAALNIATTLMTAVHERRREIGVLKAIGARDGDVLRWFLIEALILGTAGGIAGSIVGVGVAEILGLGVNNYLVGQGLGAIDLTVISPPIIAGGVVGASLLALVAAAVPALLGARVPAREAVAGE